MELSSAPQITALGERQLERKAEKPRKAVEDRKYNMLSGKGPGKRWKERLMTKREIKRKRFKKNTTLKNKKSKGKGQGQGKESLGEDKGAGSERGQGE